MKKILLIVVLVACTGVAFGIGFRIAAKRYDYFSSIVTTSSRTTEYDRAVEDAALLYGLLGKMRAGKTEDVTRDLERSIDTRLLRAAALAEQPAVDSGIRFDVDWQQLQVDRTEHPRAKQSGQTEAKINAQLRKLMDETGTGSQPVPAK